MLGGAAKSHQSRESLWRGERSVAMKHEVSAGQLLEHGLN